MNISDNDSSSIWVVYGARGVSCLVMEKGEGFNDLMRAVRWTGCLHVYSVQSLETLYDANKVELSLQNTIVG
jgi:hypothetical protein